MKFLVETDDVLAIRDNFENICLKTGIMKVNQTLDKSQFCTDLLYNYMILNQLRDIILVSFVKKAYKLEEQKSVALYVLDVNKRRRADLKRWLKEKITENASLACPLFKTRKQFWTDPVVELRVKKFIQNVDNSLMAAVNKLDSEYCEQVTQDNLREYCACNHVGLHSLICDSQSQCSCKDSYKGKRCQIGEKCYFSREK